MPSVVRRMVHHVVEHMPQRESHFPTSEVKDDALQGVAGHDFSAPEGVEPLRVSLKVHPLIVDIRHLADATQPSDVASQEVLISLPRVLWVRSGIENREPLLIRPKVVIQQVKKRLPIHPRRISGRPLSEKSIPPDYPAANRATPSLSFPFVIFPRKISSITTSYLSVVK